MSDDRPDCAGYKLVLPFIACRSAGGPHDDVSFVAGWVAATIDADLRRNLPQERYQVRPDLVAQLDLIAMHRGYTVEVVGVPTAAWVAIRFVPCEPI